MQAKQRFPGFWGRFKFYVVGLAIGCVMLGFFQMAKKNEAKQREAAAERARIEQQTNPNPLFPPIPEAERAKPATTGTTPPVPASPGPSSAGSVSPK